MRIRLTTDFEIKINICISLAMTFCDCELMIRSQTGSVYVYN